jgi:hypothetical protein
MVICLHALGIPIFFKCGKAISRFLRLFSAPAKFGNSQGAGVAVVFRYGSSCEETASWGISVFLIGPVLLCCNYKAFLGLAKEE